MKSNLHNSKITKFYKLSILLAMALGDGSINKKGTLCVQHSIKQHEYVMWKAKLIEDAFGEKINVITRKDVKFPYSRFYFTSKQTKRLRGSLYNGKKTITRGLLNLLKTPDALTIWYLDDGCMVLHKNRQKDKILSRELVLHTQSFTKEEHETIKLWLKNSFGINSRINKDRQYFKIVMNATNAKLFLDLLNEKIPVTMEYKTDMKYLY